MTWAAAYRIADEQVAWWQRHGVTAGEAEQALRVAPGEWQAVRRELAAWVKQHEEMWGE